MARTTITLLVAAAATAACAAPAGAAVTVQRSGGTVQVIGSSSNEVIAVSGGAANVRVQQTIGTVAPAAGKGCEGVKPPQGVAFAVDCAGPGIVAVDVTGQAGVDKLTAAGLTVPAFVDGGPGNDAIAGGAANDTLIGAGGADGLRGGPGIDTVSYADAAHGTPANLAGLVGVVATIGGTGSAPLADVDGTGDTIASDVEGLIGTASGDNLTGDGGANILDGGAGGDIVSGEGGADIVRGGPGDDEVDGGDGNDRLEGGDGSDGLRGEAPPSLGSGSINLAATGPSGDDLLLGGPGPDRLDGGPGNDRLDGGPANDAIQGGDGVDTLDYSARTEPLAVTIGDVTLVGVNLDPTGTKAAPDPKGTPGTPSTPAAPDLTLARVNQNDGGASDDVGGFRDSVANDVEAVLGGSGADQIAGNALANDLQGNGGADVLIGGDAADALRGGAGPDTLKARDGVADQVLDCGADTDTLEADPADPAGSGCEGGTVAAADRTKVLPLFAPKPVVKILTRRVRLSKRGQAAVKVRCTNVPARCRAVLRLVAAKTVSVKSGRRTVRVRKGQILGRQAYTVWVRKAVAVKVRLSARARKIIARRGRLTVTAKVAAADDGSPAKAAAVGRAQRSVVLLRARR